MLVECPIFQYSALKPLQEDLSATIDLITYRQLERAKPIRTCQGGSACISAGPITLINRRLQGPASTASAALVTYAANVNEYVWMPWMPSRLTLFIHGIQGLPATTGPSQVGVI